MLFTSNKSVESAKKVSEFLEIFLMNLRNYFLVFYFIGKAEKSEEELEKLEFFMKSLGIDLSAKEVVEGVSDFLTESSFFLVKSVLREILKIKEDLLEINIAEPPEKIMALIEDVKNIDNLAEEEKESILQKLSIINDKYTIA